VTDIGDGQTNRICRRPTLRPRSAGPRSTSPATAPDGRPGGSAHHRTEPDRFGAVRRRFEKRSCLRRCAVRGRPGSVVESAGTAPTTALGHASDTSSRSWLARAGHSRTWSQSQRPNQRAQRKRRQSSAWLQRVFKPDI